MYAVVSVCVVGEHLFPPNPTCKYSVSECSDNQAPEPTLLPFPPPALTGQSEILRQRERESKKVKTETQEVETVVNFIME